VDILEARNHPPLTLTMAVMGTVLMTCIMLLEIYLEMYYVGGSVCEPSSSTYMS
jgi:hypothetical protein